ncbi:thymidylate kinase-domain-containing protein [Kalaharituber pfeilii]|nr:thymidylate kinase-domain-containing protein [Kalaharituber pfeilii]
MSTDTPTPSPGALVAIEGLDRAGKSTQCVLLLKRLQDRGRKVVLQRFPDRTTPIGKMIDSYLRSGADLDDHAIHLLFSANRWELSQKILTLLSSGTTVLLDRYIHSGIVYTASKGHPIPWCRAPDIGLPLPDLVLFLDISEDIALSRGGYGGERYEKKEMQEKVRELFKRVREEEEAEGTVRWRTVDAGRGIEEVATEILEVVSGVIQEVEERETSAERKTYKVGV